jgi:hypothetical protein
MQADDTQGEDTASTDTGSDDTTAEDAGADTAPVDVAADLPADQDLAVNFPDFSGARWGHWPSPVDRASGAQGVHARLDDRVWSA